MKTAIELLKLIGFLLIVAWLCSCNDKQIIISQIHAYQDSIGINRIKQSLAIDKMRSLQEKHGTQFPPGISVMLMNKIRLESQAVMYKLTIDSLKVELEK